MQKIADTFKEITLDADPDIEKTRFLIRPINFIELEKAEEIAGNMSAGGLHLAAKISDSLDGAGPLKITDEETDALQNMTAWVKKKRTAIVLFGLIGADGARFESCDDVKAYLMNLRPLYAVRGVIDELAAAILDLSGGVEKKRES